MDIEMCSLALASCCDEDPASRELRGALSSADVVRLGEVGDALGKLSAPVEDTEPEPLRTVLLLAS